MAHVWADHKRDTFLGSGISRAVYAYDDGYVIKIEKGTYGTWANEREMALYGRIRDTLDCVYFAAIVDNAGTEWLMMERVTRTLADTIPEGCEGNGHYDCNELITNPAPEIERLMAVGQRYGIHDIHAHNIGQRADGSWCFIDYAA